MTALARETDKKARRELLTGLCHVCGRHLLDLRAQAYFEAALSDRDKTIRVLGVAGCSG